MANYDPSMESAREMALRDKKITSQGYCPPPVCEMKYRITDTFLHCCYYYRSRRKYNKMLHRFEKFKDFDKRFICTHSK